MKKIKVKVSAMIRISEGIKIIESPINGKNRENQHASLGLVPPIILGIYVQRVEPAYEHGYYDLVANKNSIFIPAQNFREDRINVIIEMEVLSEEGEYLIVKAILESEGLHQAQIKIRKDILVE